jgi:AraC-like DNA-binding protein
MDKIEVALPVHFFSAGQFVAPKGWVHPRRCIDTSVLFCVESGRFILWEDDRRIVVNAHEAVILRAGHTHMGEPAGDGELPVYYWAHFHADTPLSPDEKNQVTLEQHCFCDNYDKVAVYFHQLIHESRSRLTLPLSFDYLMSLILIQLAEQDKEPNFKTLHTRIQAYVHMNYRSNITLKQLAHVFPYSTDYLSRVFKKSAGISIRKYQHILRITEAKRRLLSTLDTIKEIANDCGYTNEKFFITMFSKMEGLTPTQYRNLFANLHQNDK